MERKGSALNAERTRYEEGWRRGKPEEDPAKLKSWGLITASPSEFLVCMRRGQVVASGQGASCFKWPWDSVAVVPTTVQRLQFTADQVTAEKVGVEVTGLAVYRIAEPLIAFRMLNFSYAERASEKLEQMLEEMFVGAARRLVASMSVEQVLTRRKEGLAGELLREIAPIVSGSGRAEDRTHKGWGVILDTIEIQNVRVLSAAVFSNMQARFRHEQERLARESELSKLRTLEQQKAHSEREVQLARVAAESEVRARRQAAEEQVKLEQLAQEARLVEARLSRQRELERTRLEAELEKVQFQAQAAAARHEAELASQEQAAYLLSAQANVALARAQLARAQLEAAEVEAKKAQLAQELELSKARSLKALDNDVSPQAIQLAVAQKLPELAAAFQQQMGQVHVTAVDGANPFGYIAAAVEGVLGLARSAGLAPAETTQTTAHPRSNSP